MNVFTPNSKPSSNVRAALVAGWVVFLALAWTALKPTVFPSPVEIIGAFPGLWNEGLGQELISSFIVNVEALCLSSFIGLPLSFLSRTACIAPFTEGLSKLRFVGSAVFFLPLVFLFNTGHDVKVALLVIGELFWLVTTMSGVVRGLPESLFDDARTLRMSEWRSVWYVVVRGTVSQSFDAIRDNAAMGWSMLMFVEGVVRSEGGVGVMILNNEKHTNFAEVFAITLAIVAVGIGQDWFIGQVKRVMCPYVL